MYDPVKTRQFVRDVKRCKKRGKHLNKLIQTMATLLDGDLLPIQYQDHILVGNYKGWRECHIESDWLLIYKIDELSEAIIFERTGTHSDLFN